MHFGLPLEMQEHMKMCTINFDYAFDTTHLKRLRNRFGELMEDGHGLRCIARTFHLPEFSTKTQMMSGGICGWLLFFDVSWVGSCHQGADAAEGGGGLASCVATKGRPFVEHITTDSSEL